MAKFNMVVSHGLPQGEAQRGIRGEIENLNGEYGDKVGDLRESWRNDTYVFEGVAKGFGVSGLVTVGPCQIEIRRSCRGWRYPSKTGLKQRFRSACECCLVDGR